MSRVYYPQARAILQVVFDGFGPNARDTEPRIIPVIPMEVRITRNSYRQADSWEIVFEGNDFPVDPRLVRAGAAEIFLFETPGLVNEQRVISRARSFDDSANRVPRTPREAIAIEQRLAGAVDRFTFGNKPIISGLFDRHSLSLDDSGKRVTLVGQDYTTLFIKRQWPPLPNGRARRIPVGRRLDIILRELIADADPDGVLELVIDGVRESAIPTVGAKESRCHKRGIPVDQETNLWDIMYGLATRYGFILFVRNQEVVLTRPQNLNEKSGGKVRRMAWGHNLTNLNLDRELGKEISPTVVVRSYDPATRQTIEIDHPPGFFKKSKRSRRKAISQTTVKAEEEFVIVPVYGITDRAVLKKIAETRYNLLGRPERKVTFSTRDLRDIDNNPIININAGEAFAVEFREFNKELLSNDSVTEGQKVAHLTQRGFGEAIARVIAQSYTKLKFLERPLRLREASIDFTNDDGITIEAELVDFIIIDGIRESEGAESRKAKGARRFVGADGKPKGSRVISTGGQDADLRQKDVT